MLRIFVYIGLLALLVSGVTWLADRPGEVSLIWLGYHVQISLLVALLLLCCLVALLVVVWASLRGLLHLPAGLKRWRAKQRANNGRRALTRGMLALAAGDILRARQLAKLAVRDVPHDPLTLLLQAQIAQMDGDVATASRLFHAMLPVPEARLLGLRGLHMEARRRGDHEEGVSLAKSALSHAGGSTKALPWAHDAVFDHAVAKGDYVRARQLLATRVRAHPQEKLQGQRLQGVLCLAEAMGLAEVNPSAAMTLAKKALKFAPNLVPASCLLASLAKAMGKIGLATKVLKRSYALFPHPDLVALFLSLRYGDSAKDRLARAKILAKLSPHHKESALAVAASAVEAGLFDEARQALAPLLVAGAEAQVSVRVCLIMAQIEEQDASQPDNRNPAINAEMAREWLARAAYAPRDEAWLCDGVVYDHWAPVSPNTGALDAFVWQSPLGAQRQTVMLPPMPQMSLPQSSPLQSAPLQSPPPQINAPPDLKAIPEAETTDLKNIDGISKDNQSIDETAPKTTNAITKKSRFWPIMTPRQKNANVDDSIKTDVIIKSDVIMKSDEATTASNPPEDAAPDSQKPDTMPPSAAPQQKPRTKFVHEDMGAAFPAPPDIPSSKDGQPIKAGKEKANGGENTTGRLFRQGVTVSSSQLKQPLSSPPDDPGLQQPKNP